VLLFHLYPYLICIPHCLFIHRALPNKLEPSDTHLSPILTLFHKILCYFLFIQKGFNYPKLWWILFEYRVDSRPQRYFYLLLQMKCAKFLSRFASIETFLELLFHNLWPNHLSQSIFLCFWVILVGTKSDKTTDCISSNNATLDELQLKHYVW